MINAPRKLQPIIRGILSIDPHREKIDIIKQLIDLLRMHRKNLDANLLADNWLIDYFLQQIPENYAQSFDATSLKFLKEDLISEKWSMKRFIPYVDKLLWQIFVFQSSQICPQCHDDELRYLFSQKEQKVLLSCDICCWTQEINGTHWHGNGLGLEKLIPASKEILAQL